MKKIVFPHLLCACLMIAGLSSCKKDGSSPSAFEFRAKFDGTEKVFSKATSATKATFGGVYNLVLLGVSDNESLSIALWSDQDNFTAGKTYTVDASGTGTINSLNYGPLDGSSQWSSFYLYSSVTEKFDCTITESTSTGIKGTFSGYIYKNESGTPQKINVTEGTFSAKF